jgi:hypothetical protein
MQTLLRYVVITSLSLVLGCHQNRATIKQSDQTNESGKTQKSLSSETVHCRNNLLQLWAAGLSFSIEHDVNFEGVLTRRELTPYAKGDWPPCCPSSGTAYETFRIEDGPKCPSYDDHTREFQKWMCAANMANLWECAVVYAGKKNLGWRDVINPVDVFSHDNPILHKCTSRCPLKHIAYSPFVLADGPRCPNDTAHTIHAQGIFRTLSFFDSRGVLKTNTPPRELGGMGHP